MDSRWIREVVSTEDAPAAVGPYSQAVAVGPLVFVSMQLGLVPGTKDMAGDDITAQTVQAMENIASILEASSSSLDLIVKATVFLKDMGHFKDFNASYGGFFPESPPARAAVQVGALPLNALVGIDVIALRD
ncbi:MAG: Rid family detoxifying hydrolase [Candidatus Thermoplasmatota archaeon]|jgi:2-iminobutanoate/2-iminopropanoate deaminase|nr:Rid family detoxifying hydrolase [Candidatus Thermoplasmatota archaeon]